MSGSKLSLFAAAWVASIAGCTSPVARNGGPSAAAPAVLSVTPANATIGVDPSKPVVVTFSRAMMTGMEMLVVLHEGSVTGPQVAGTSSWSTDRTSLTFTPAAALKAHTTYVLHLSPGLAGANGEPIDFGSCAKLGAQAVSGAMMGQGGMGAGMMNGAWGPGMMGAGWKAADGTFGMLFTFATA